MILVAELIDQVGDRLKKISSAMRHQGGEWVRYLGENGHVPVALACRSLTHNGLGGRGKTSAGEADGQLFQPQLEGNGLSIGAVHRACIKVRQSSAVAAFHAGNR